MPDDLDGSTQIDRSLYSHTFSCANQAVSALLYIPSSGYVFFFFALGESFGLDPKEDASFHKTHVNPINIAATVPISTRDVASPKSRPPSVFARSTGT